MDFNALVEKMKNEIITSTQELIHFKSVQASPVENGPFGEGVKNALGYALKLAESMGFQVKNLDGYIGYAEYLIDPSFETVGVLSHLDVVPEGDNWQYPPYAAEIHNDRIYGRGAIDDKGPTIAVLYALKAIKDSKVKLNKNIRIIFGANEETGWKCMNYYREHEERPSIGFTPDADFPLVFAEKGILTYSIDAKINHVKEGCITLKSLKGGNAPNMVPDYCEAVLSVKADKKDAYKIIIHKLIGEYNVNIKVCDSGNELILKSYGESAHGSTPELGINAIVNLLRLIYRLDLPHDDIYNYFSYFAEKIGISTNGIGLGLNLSDQVSGKLTLNVGVISIDDKECRSLINIRYPVSFGLDDIESKIKKSLYEGFVYTNRGGNAPLYVNQDSELVKKLLKVYREFTGDTENKPLAIGGGTYARAFDNFVAFGPLFPGDEDIAHQKNEYIKINHLLSLAKIYSKAMYELSI